jgi:hypothetical protein
VLLGLPVDASSGRSRKGVKVIGMSGHLNGLVNRKRDNDPVPHAGKTGTPLRSPATSIKSSRIAAIVHPLVHASAANTISGGATSIRTAPMSRE